MSVTSFAKKIMESVGKNNSPRYAVVAIATANGIFKPLSTLLDKKEKPETKKYTALREFLTECIAIPIYIGCSFIAEKFVKGIKDPQRAKLAKSNLGFLGVCAAAALVIPAFCSVVIKPMTDMIYHKGAQKSQPAKVETKSGAVFEASEKKVYPYSNYHTCSFASFRNGGMKV